MEYAHKYFNDNPGSKVHWVNASSVEQLQLSYRRIAEGLHLSTKSRESCRVVEAVHHCLQRDSSGAWLIVLDGLEKETTLTTTDSLNSGKSLLDRMPTGLHARILITTRSKSLAKRLIGENDKYMLRVGSLMAEDAPVLLGSARLDKARIQSTLDLAAVLKNSAGGLTLAQSYLKKKGKYVTVKRYMELLSGRPEKQSTTARAWELLYDLIKTDHPDAADLMLVISALDVQCIPDTFLSRHDASELIPILEDYGMVEPSQDRRIFFMTPKFRSFGHAWLVEHEKQTSIEELALTIMLQKFKGDTREVLLPCALVILKFQPTSTESKCDLAALLFQVSEYYVELMQPRRALKFLEKCLSLRQKDSNSNTAQALIEETKRAIEKANDLMLPSDKRISVSETGKSFDNKEFQEDKHFLEIETKDPKWHHRSTVRMASDEAALQMEKGQYDGLGNSVVLYQRVLDWLKGKDEVRQLDLARNEYNLALAHDGKGQLGDAEKHYRNALQLISEDMNLNKPDSTTEELFLKTLGSLAATYCTQGRFEEAEEAFQVVHPRQMVTLGPNHPETLVTRHNVALLLQQRGDLAAAANELPKVLMAQHYLLGAGDPATLRTACSIALSLRVRGKLNESKKWYEAVLESQIEILGVKHVDTILTKLMLEELVREIEN